MLADFGVSQMVNNDADLISKSAGTPAFMAPGPLPSPSSALNLRLLPAQTGNESSRPARQRARESTAKVGE